jgi:PAS domain-containing protein
MIQHPAIFTAVRDAIFLADIDTGMIVDANPAAEAISGRTSSDNARERKLTRTLAPRICGALPPTPRRRATAAPETTLRRALAGAVVPPAVFCRRTISPHGCRAGAVCARGGRRARTECAARARRRSSGGAGNASAAPLPDRRRSSRRGCSERPRRGRGSRAGRAAGRERNALRGNLPALCKPAF